VHTKRLSGDTLNQLINQVADATLPDYHFQDFTEGEYRKLVRLAKANWKLIPFADYRTEGRVCLWRHDVDFSPHRALRLAQIEAEEGVHATYFVLLHSNFYNAFEKEIITIIRRIRDLGHDLGLHFEANSYLDRLKHNDSPLDMIFFEQSILSTLFEAPIRALSLHNPTVGDWLTNLDEDEIGGMVNAYGRYITKQYYYCSDSNGYWRFRRLNDVLEAATDERLHVLTHDAWWTSYAMSPRERISRCIEGRAARQHQAYDKFLAESGRENIR